MTVATPAPSVLPRAPRDYSSSFFNQFASQITNAINLIRTGGPWRASTLVLTNLPTTGNQLEIGAVFNSLGTLMIVQDYIGYAPSLVMTSAIGDVTIVTT